MQIIFDGEAGETYDRILGELHGLAGEVTPQGGGEAIPCMIGRVDHGAGWHGTIKIRRWDFDTDTPIRREGEPVWESIAVDSVLIY